MARRRNLTLLILSCTAALAAHAQLAGLETNEAQVRALLSHEKLIPGLQFHVAVVVELAGHWHVNANPTTLPELIPTTLTLRSPDSVVIERIVYPKGQPTQVGWADEPVALYSGRAIIFAEGRVRDNATPGPVSIEGELRYQACDDQVCLAPKTIPVRIETEIAEATVTPLPVHPEIFAATPPAVPVAPQTPNPIATMIEEQRLVLTFLFVFLGGLALNLTPCVYPMIAITVSYFGGQGERTLGRAFSYAFVYFLGVVLTYSTIGLVTALTGGLFGGLLQSPVLLIGLAVLFVVLALSMFGLFEIRPPQFLMQRATGLSTKAGYVGVFFLGAVVGIIAAPCLAPVLVALLVYVGQRADPWMGWWLFFVLACGLGLPYVVLGTFTGLLARLPKSGTWMAWVKRVMGVVLIGVALWFIKPLYASKTVPLSPIAWQAYSPELVANARGKPVLIDFSADWCIPCHEMDKKTYSDQRVIDASKKFLMLKADLTKTGSPEVLKLTDEFKIVGVPTHVFMDANGRERTELRQIGFTPPDEFLDVMQRAARP